MIIYTLHHPLYHTLDPRGLRPEGKKFFREVVPEGLNLRGLKVQNILHRSTQSFLSCWALHKLMHRSTQSFLSCWALHKILHRSTQSFLSCWALHKILIPGNQRQETLIAKAMDIIRAEQEKSSGQEGRRMLL